MAENTMIQQFRPFFGPEELAYVKNTLDSGWVNEGPRTEEFEKRWAEMVHAKHVIATTSGTTALYLIMKALKVKMLDHVALPAYTFISDLQVVRWLGAKPVFFDIDERGLIEPNGKAWDLMIAVNSNGRVCPDWIYEDNVIIEDSCQSPEQHNPKALATFYSLASTKHITTGQGGMIATDDQALANRITALKDNGRWKKYLPYSETGLNWKFDDIRASIGLCQLERWPQTKRWLWNLYRQYDKRLENQMVERHAKETPWYADIYVEDAEETVKKAREKGIELRRHYLPLNREQIASETDKKTSFDNAETFYHEGLYLPTHQFLKPEEIVKIMEVVQN